MVQRVKTAAAAVVLAMFQVGNDVEKLVIILLCLQLL